MEMARQSLATDSAAGERSQQYCRDPPLRMSDSWLYPHVLPPSESIPMRHRLTVTVYSALEQSDYMS